MKGKREFPQMRRCDDCRFYPSSSSSLPAGMGDDVEHRSIVNSREAIRAVCRNRMFNSRYHSISSNTEARKVPVHRIDTKHPLRRTLMARRGLPLPQDIFKAHILFSDNTPDSPTYSPSAMVSLALPSILRTSTRALRRNPVPALSPCLSRKISTKHPVGFAPPTEDDLLELRERVQDFTSMRSLVLV
jgi:hypothetical protein